MDFRLKQFSISQSSLSPRIGLLHIGERLSQIAAHGVSRVERARPLASKLYAPRRRIATVAVLAIAVFLFVHVMFGANGMVVYKQKRIEYQSLEKRIAQEQTENDLYTQQIQGLKTDQRAIEKEAREQLHYARPGEYVYVPAVQPAPPQPPVNRSARK